jgi:sortase A
VAGVLISLGALVLAFVLFVIVFGGLRHTARQETLEEALRARVAAGHAARPNWAPLPGQAIATISIPAIDVFEVVVQDTTPELLKSGPGHLLGAPLPGQRGNVILLGRRLTDGGPFRRLDELSNGDRITTVTPSGAYVYTVAQVVRIDDGAPEAFRATDDARMTLVTSASSVLPNDRTVVVALLQGTPVESAGEPIVHQRPVDLGTSGDPRSWVQVLAWGAALVLALVVWGHERSRIGSRFIRFLIATPVALVLLYFLFVNAETLLPGVI